MTCVCGSEKTQIRWQLPHLRLECARCRKWIKWLPQIAENVAGALPENTATDGQLDMFGDGEKGG